MKKKIIRIAILLLLLTAVCLAVHFTLNPTFVPSGDENAAQRVAESWLDKQISLRDYEVTEAHFFTFEDPQTKYVDMCYSVRPYKIAFKDWYSGNGESGDDDWLVNKYGFISYRRFGPIIVTGTACNTGP